MHENSVRPAIILGRTDEICEPVRLEEAVTGERRRKQRHRSVGEQGRQSVDDELRGDGMSCQFFFFTHGGIGEGLDGSLDMSTGDFAGAMQVQ